MNELQHLLLQLNAEAIAKEFNALPKATRAAEVKLWFEDQDGYQPLDRRILFAESCCLAHLVGSDAWAHPAKWRFGIHSSCEECTKSERRPDTVVQMCDPCYRSALTLTDCPHASHTVTVSEPIDLIAYRKKES